MPFVLTFKATSKSNQTEHCDGCTSTLFLRRRCSADLALLNSMQAERQGSSSSNTSTQKTRTLILPSLLEGPNDAVLDLCRCILIVVVPLCATFSHAMNTMNTLLQAQNQPRIGLCLTGYVCIQQPSPAHLAAATGKDRAFVLKSIKLVLNTRTCRTTSNQVACCIALPMPPSVAAVFLRIQPQYIPQANAKAIYPLPATPRSAKGLKCRNLF